MKPHLTFIDPTGKTLAEIEIEKLPFKIGRSSDNDLPIQHPSVSRYHCRIEDRGGQVWLVDQDSVNGIRFQSDKKKEILLTGAMDLKLGEIRVLYRGAVAEPAGDGPTMVASVSSNLAHLRPAAGFDDEKTKAGAAASDNSVFDEKTVVRKPQSKPATLPSIKKPSLGFEEKTQTNFKIKAEEKTNHIQWSSQSESSEAREGLQFPHFGNFLEKLKSVINPLVEQLQSLPKAWLVGIAFLILAGFWAWSQKTSHTQGANQTAFWTQASGEPQNLSEFLRDHDFTATE